MTEVWSILEQKDKNFWMRTRYGLKKWTRYGFTTYTEDNGTNIQQPNSIFEDAAGELFASFNDGNIRTVSRFDSVWRVNVIMATAGCEICLPRKRPFSFLYFCCENAEIPIRQYS